MKSLSSSLQTHLAEEVTTLATCWKLTRRDSVVLGFTDHDRDVVVEGVTYLAATGFTPTAVSSSSALNVDNLDIEGMLDSEIISEADLMAGLYDFAEVEVFQVNFTAPDEGVLRLRTGWLGELTLKGGRFVAELRGLTQRLSQTVGSLYSPSCRADLGDARCKVSMAGFTVTGTVDNSTTPHGMMDAARTEAAGYFSGGTLTFLSGDNAGISMEVKEFREGRMVFVLPFPYPVGAGDSYRVTAGCDKSFATCQSVFANAVNFRGEPHVPGLDRILETASTRSSW